jgi:hypothetical protein
MTSMTAASRRCVVPSPSGPAACPVTVTPAPPAAPAATLRAGEGKSIRESGLGEGRLLLMRAGGGVGMHAVALLLLLSGYS